MQWMYVCTDVYVGTVLATPLLQPPTVPFLSASGRWTRIWAPRPFLGGVVGGSCMGWGGMELGMECRGLIRGGRSDEWGVGGEGGLGGGEGLIRYTGSGGRAW